MKNKIKNFFRVFISPGYWISAGLIELSMALLYVGCVYDFGGELFFWVWFFIFHFMPLSVVGCLIELWYKKKHK